MAENKLTPGRVEIMPLMPPMLTKREYFAAKIMAAYIAYPGDVSAPSGGPATFEDIADLAIKAADALVAALAKKSDA